MSPDRVVVAMARIDYAGPRVQERFFTGVVKEGQLLLADDPLVQGSPTHWVPVGTADAATATLIQNLGRTATYQLLASKLGPLDPDPPPASPPQTPVRRRGRPKGTRSVPKNQIVERFWSLRASYGRNPTQGELAENLEPPITVRTLGEHLDAYGLDWPIE